jgi:hypothetical protein
LKRIFLITILTFFTVVNFNSYADTDDVFKWTWEGGTKSLTVGYTTDLKSEGTNISTGAKCWNGIDDNVNISGVYYDNNTSHIKVQTGTGNANVVAYAKLYNKNWLGGYTNESMSAFTGTTDYCTVTVCTANYNNYNDVWKRAVISHEVGHCLALDHPSPAAYANMSPTLTVNYSTTPATHDMDNLKAKW